MKKTIGTIMMCMLLILSSVCTNAMEQESTYATAYNIEFNGEPTEYTGFIDNGICYVPMRKAFELLGGEVFYRSRDCCVMALSRDGDLISHVIGSNVITVNGVEKTFETSSVVKNNETYISADMLFASFAPDGFSCNEQKICIQKIFYSFPYHSSINIVLNGCRNNGFYPEKFHEYINYLRQRPELNIQEVVYLVNLGLDAPFYQDVVAAENPYSSLVLVNKYNKLPSNFTPHNLVNMEKKYTINDGKQYLLTKDTYSKYVEMAEAAKKDGLSLKVVSAYRTEDYQGGLYNNSVRRNGKVYADNYSARAGHSEHQTGLAVDINSVEGIFAYTSEFKWLQQHAHKYGFIMRYPKGKEWITGYAYEPWHYRYVGIEAATRIYEEGITYEEYYVKNVAPTEYK